MYEYVFGVYVYCCLPKNSYVAWLVVAALQAAASPCARAIDCCSHAHAKSLHALWPITAPMVRLNQSERDLPAAPIRTRELSSRLTGQRRSLGLFGASRLNTHASHNTTFKAVLFQYNSPSPLFVFGHRAILFWDWPRITLDSSPKNFTFMHNMIDMLSSPKDLSPKIFHPTPVNREMFIF